MFGDMMGKLNDMKKQVEETKARLSTLSVKGASHNNKVIVTADGNRTIKDVEIDDSLFKVGDREEIQDLLVIALNNALDNAKKLEEAEMQGAAKGILPNIPGLGL